MLNVYLEAAQMHDLERVLARRQQLQAAQAAQPSHPRYRFPGVNTVFVGLSTRLVLWGHRLQQAHAPSISDEVTGTARDPDTEGQGAHKRGARLLLRSIVNI